MCCLYNAVDDALARVSGGKEKWVVAHTFAVNVRRARVCAATAGVGGERCTQLLRLQAASLCT
jgi:hypothetical protein